MEIAATENDTAASNVEAAARPARIKTARLCRLTDRGTYSSSQQKYLADQPNDLTSIFTVLQSISRILSPQPHL
jgi:hypothetical protein